MSVLLFHIISITIFKLPPTATRLDYLKGQSCKIIQPPKFSEDLAILLIQYKN